MCPPVLLQAPQCGRLASHLQILFFPIVISCRDEPFFQSIAFAASRRESAPILRKQLFHLGATAQKPVPQELLCRRNQFVRRQLAGCKRTSNALPVDERDTSMS